MRQWLREAGIWKDRRQRRKRVYQPRYRRESLGELIQIDTGSAAFRRQYESLGAERAGGLNELFRSMGIDLIEVVTDRDYVRDLVKFFRTRERRAAR